MSRYICFFCLFIFFQACKTSQQTKEAQVENILLDSIEISAPRSNPYRASATRDFDLVHTRLEVKFDYARQYLFGKATLTLKPHFYPQYNLVLDAKSFEIREVSLLSANNQRTPLPYTYDSLQLKIQLNKRYTADEMLQLYIDYVAKPEERISGGSEAISSDKGLYFINPLGTDTNKPVQVWTQSETEAGSCWFPTIDKPNQKTTQEIFITHDKKYVSLSNGRLISSTDNKDGTVTDYWKQDLPHAPYLFMMTIGDFFVLNEMWRDVPVSYYVEKKYAPFAKKIFGNTPEMMEFFSQKLGFDYPWAKYAQVVVRDYVSGAMENTSATLHSEILQRNSRELLDETFEDYISHELFHQWFGDLVTCESWSNIPLNESFATYGEYLWAEYKYGKDAADHRWQDNYEKYMQESEIKNVDLIRFYYDDKEDMFDRHSYEKGGLILHYLRHLIGDEAFFKGIALYLKTHQFKTVEVHQLRLAFEEVTGRDLNWFFNQWFLNKGHPVLDIKTVYRSDSAFVELSQKHNDGAALTYILPMHVDLWFGTEVQRERIELSGKKQTFGWPVSRTPDWIDVDAERVVLCTRNENTDAEHYVFQFNHSKHFVSRYDALSKLAEKQKENENARAILRQAMCDPQAPLRQMAVEKMSLPADNAENIYTLLDSIAQDDKNSHVRASAVEKLGESKWADKYNALFTKMTGDSSYLVSSEALKALNKVNAAKALELAAGFESDENYHNQLAIAAVYAESGNENHRQFFERSLSRPSNSSYSMVYYFANFLYRMNKNEVLRGIAVIEKAGSDKSNDALRLSARGALKRIVRLFEDKKKKVQQENSTDAGTTAKASALETVTQCDEIVAAAQDAIQRLNKP